MNNNKIWLALKMSLLGVSLYISILLLIQSAIEMDRQMYIHDYHYEYVTLGDVGKSLFEKAVKRYEEYKAEKE